MNAYELKTKRLFMFPGRGILIGGLVLFMFSAIGCSAKSTYRVYTCSGYTYINDSKIYYKNSKKRVKLLERNHHRISKNR